MLNHIFVIVFAFSINGIISLPVLEQQINPNEENTNIRRQDGAPKTNESAQHSVLEEIKDAVYFPPSNGNLMHRIAVRIKNDANNTKNCAIKVWRENSTEMTDSPITIECDESKKRKRSVSPNPNPPTQLSTDNDDVKKFATIGVEKYAHVMVNSSASSLHEIVDAFGYPPGHNLLYKIKILMDHCDRKMTGNCEKMRCIVYVWRDTVLDRPVSIECDPTRRKRDIIIPHSRGNSSTSRDEMINRIKLQMARDAAMVINNMSRRRRDSPAKDDDHQAIKMKVDDPLIKKYAQMAIDKYGSPNLPDRKAIILDIADATMFPSSDQIYEIKLKVGSTKCKHDSDEKNCVYDPESGFNECEIKVYKSMVTMLCFGVGRRKREMNIPVKLTLDDPQIKKYVDLVVDRHVSPVASAKDKTSILQKFQEATAYPPACKLCYQIKLRIGTTNCTKGSEEHNCVYNSEIGYDECEIDVYRETETKERISTLCSRIDRRKRQVQTEGTVELTMEDPEIKKYVDAVLEKHVPPLDSAKDKKLIIQAFREALSYPPSDNLRYKIKLRIGTTNCTRGSEERNCVYDSEIGYEDCEINVSGVTDKEPTIQTVCSSILRKKRELQTEDSPINLTIDNPEIKKYVDAMLEKHVPPLDSAKDKKLIIQAFREALSYPPSDNLRYKIKLRIGTTNCTRGSEEQNCVYDSEIGYEDCEINVSGVTDKEPTIQTVCSSILRRKRELQTEDSPINLTMDNPEIKKYVDAMLEKHIPPLDSAKDKKLIIQAFREALSYPPSDNLRYKIKLRIGTTNCTRGSEEQNCVYDSEIGYEDCEINVSGVTDKEPTIQTVCSSILRRKRELQTEDSPINLTMEDPEIKKYVDDVLEKHVPPLDSAKDKKLIIQAFREALSYPPSDNLRYKIKLRIGTTNCTKGSEEQNCVYDSEIGYENCEINVSGVTDKEPTIQTVCSSILRRKRELQTEDSPINLTMEDPEIKKYVDAMLEKHIPPLDSAKDKKLIIQAFKEALSYPPSDNLRYKIKLRIGTTNCTRGSEEQNCVYDSEIGYEDCEINVSGVTDKEPTIQTVCSSILRRKRELQTEDSPVKLTMEDPEIKKYIDMVVDKHVSPVPIARNKVSVVHEFKGALSYPPPDKLQYKINLRIGSTNCTKGSDELNCQYDSTIGYSDCEIDVLRETNVGPAVTTLCSKYHTW